MRFSRLLFSQHIQLTRKTLLPTLDLGLLLFAIPMHGRNIFVFTWDWTRNKDMMPSIRCKRRAASSSLTPKCTMRCVQSGEIPNKNKSIFFFSFAFIFNIFIFYSFSETKIYLHLLHADSKCFIWENRALAIICISTFHALRLLIQLSRAHIIHIFILFSAIA